MSPRTGISGQLPSGPALTRHSGEAASRMSLSAARSSHHRDHQVRRSIVVSLPRRPRSGRRIGVSQRVAAGPAGVAQAVIARTRTGTVIRVRTTTIIWARTRTRAGIRTRAITVIRAGTTGIVVGPLIQRWRNDRQGAKQQADKHLCPAGDLCRRCSRVNVSKCAHAAVPSCGGTVPV